ncbi:MAG: exosome complex exonuclease Rrp41 [Candidatus Helarchaeota archaeon]|nr:exosome complex exonuclease Rrp41 [Candidatus Helarchaeota archaeon]
MALIKFEPPERLIDKNGLRMDKRKFNDLRPVSFKLGILPNCDGSAYVEMGGNKIVVGVYGPRKVQPRHIAHPNEMVIRTLYRMATFSVDERKSPAPSRREVELSMVIRNALIPSVFINYYPKTLIDVSIQVLAADGGTRCACINAASLAIADAGIAQRDLVSAVAVGKINGKIVLDLSDVEDKEGEADLPIAIMPQSNKITLLQFDGKMTKDEFVEAMNLGLEGIKKIYKLQQEAIRAKFIEIPEKKEEQPEIPGDD